MPRFKVYIDEKVYMWQTVGVIVEAESEEAIAKGQFSIEEYTGHVDPFHETQDHIEWDLDSISSVSEIETKDLGYGLGV